MIFQDIYFNGGTARRARSTVCFIIFYIIRTIRISFIIYLNTVIIIFSNSNINNIIRKTGCPIIVQVDTKSAMCCVCIADFFRP